MAGQNTVFRACKTIAGAGLAGLGLFILHGNLAAQMVRVTHRLAVNGSAALGLLPAAIPLSFAAFADLSRSPAASVGIFTALFAVILAAVAGDAGNRIVAGCLRGRTSALMAKKGL
jgi:hypothetical protein